MASTPLRRGYHALIGVLTAAAVLGFSSARATDDLGSTTAPTPRDIERMIRDYIMDHPEVIIESVQQHQEKQAKEAELQAKAEVVSARAELEDDQTSPVVGNLKGDVTIVEFFDYRCGYCKRVFPGLRDLVEQDGNIRYVLKEFPVLGEASVMASRASLAVWAEHPERYFDFHAALIMSRGNLDEERVFGVAEHVGINPKDLEAAMAKPEITAKIEQVRELAGRLNIRGTPAFVIGDELVPGAVSMDQLKALVEQARQS